MATVLCAQNSSLRRAISENSTISSHFVSPSIPPVVCCSPFDRSLTLKMDGFHRISLPITGAISRRVASPRVCNSLHEVAKIYALSRGTQNSIVTVSNQRPRKNAKVVGGTSFRIVSNPKALISLVMMMIAFITFKSSLVPLFEGL